MEEKKSNISFNISLIFNVILIGLLTFAFIFHINNKDNSKSTRKIISLENRLGSIKERTIEFSTSYSLMQDQYKKNISEIESIVKIDNLSREISMLTDKDEKKSVRITTEIKNWMSVKSSYTIYIDDMMKQLNIQLIRLEDKPSYEIRDDIQKTISNIVLTLINRTLVQSNRFYALTNNVKMDIKTLTD